MALWTTTYSCKDFHKEKCSTLPFSTQQQYSILVIVPLEYFLIFGKASLSEAKFNKTLLPRWWWNISPKHFFLKPFLLLHLGLTLKIILLPDWMSLSCLQLCLPSHTGDLYPCWQRWSLKIPQLQSLTSPWLSCQFRAPSFFSYQYLSVFDIMFNILLAFLFFCNRQTLWWLLPHVDDLDNVLRVSPIPGTWWTIWPDILGSWF